MQQENNAGICTGAFCSILTCCIKQTFLSVNNNILLRSFLSLTYLNNYLSVAPPRQKRISDGILEASSIFSLYKYLFHIFLCADSLNPGETPSNSTSHPDQLYPTLLLTLLLLFLNKFIWNDLSLESSRRDETIRMVVKPWLLVV